MSVDVPLHTQRIKQFGWSRDLPDHRDLSFTAPPAQVPDKVDLRAQCPPVYDQGELGSCTANAIGGAVQFALEREQLADFVPSRLFIYYNERVIEGDPDCDRGAQLRDGIKVVNKIGVCPEPEWPYDLAKWETQPSQSAYTDAQRTTATSYARIDQNVDDMRARLASGLPFVFGFTVYESFESPEVATTGNVPMPDSKEKVVGGHAVLAVGYDDAEQRFLARNSWGPDWGQDGYFTMPYEYLTNPHLSSDFWCIEVVT